MNKRKLEESGRRMKNENMFEMNMVMVIRGCDIEDNGDNLKVER